MVQLISRLIVEDVVDGSVRAAIEDVLLIGIGKGQGCWITSGWGCVGSGGPLVMVQLISRLIVEDVVDGSVRAAIEDVLLIGIGKGQGCWITSGWGCVGSGGPLVMVQLISRLIVEDVVDGSVCAAIEDVLLIGIGKGQGCWITSGWGCVGSGGPLVMVQLISRLIVEDVVDGSVCAAIEDVLLLRPQHRRRIAGGCWRVRLRRP